jgi:hypothetical protein
MDRFHELNAFIAVVEAGGFTAAARRTGDSQSAIRCQGSPVLAKKPGERSRGFFYLRKRARRGSQLSTLKTHRAMELTADVNDQ